MLDFTNTQITRIAAHRIGNKANDEKLMLSKEPISAEDTRLKEVLFSFFLAPFQSPEFYNFTFSNQDFTLNPLFTFSSKLFEQKNNFHKLSCDIAHHLYEVSTHPQIKAGDLFVVFFRNLSVNGHVLNAIGLFKSENKQAFLQLDSDNFELNLEEGINCEKLDKGCLIFDDEANKGYRLCIVDKANKSLEAHYWRDNFLQIRPRKDEYHQTKDFLSLAKTYVTAGLTADFEVNKTEQIELLNRSMEYFKTHESFNKGEFEREVFQDTAVIKSFRSFDKLYREDNDIEFPDNFDISDKAVKKQARVFKSVLKLDKNFHIYIHGNKELIEQGIEKDGRKFYKIYYTQEN
ncbi:MAG: nucleoid-associated protein [Bacteroidetes bacterium]|nr:nucleoid-associated protein [Bacteroidota bacterium]MBK9671852.1 nucleoid-associated protein [Bacteroidota bacterium]MBK9798575.1 nucleoid-associated protein [Bacteroidota bacterium]MBP6414769.1 nucleoid-associated protein [Bacteroidia bacterium]